MLFGSTIRCQICGAVVEKKKMNRFDSTVRGSFKGGKKLKLCGNCLMDEFEESISNFNSARS